MHIKTVNAMRKFRRDELGKMNIEIMVDQKGVELKKYCTRMENEKS